MVEKYSKPIKYTRIKRGIKKGSMEIKIVKESGEALVRISKEE